MSTPQRTEDFREHVDSIQVSPDNPQSFTEQDLTEQVMLQCRVDEQSLLISILKDRADKLLLQNQALQKMNSSLEEQAANSQKKLENERKRAEMLEKRFTDLAANNQALISFMKEHKTQNAQLKLENKQLQLENQSHFSQKLQDREELIQKLEEDLKLLQEKLAKDENTYREKLAESESKLQEQTAEHQAKETQLLSQLHEVQQQHTEAVDICEDLKLKLKESKEQNVLKETAMKEKIETLIKEKDKLLIISIERGKAIQDKQKEIQEVETKWNEEKKARTKAQNRFTLEAEAVNADLRVKSLHTALDESNTKLQKLNMEFDAFKEHSTSLLTQERDLNKILRHMTS